MEFKVVFYILAGIIWFIAKVLNANNKQKPVPMQVPVPKEVSGSKSRPGHMPKKNNLPQATPASSRRVITPKSYESTRGLEQITKSENRLFRRKEVEMDTSIVQKVQILENAELERGSDVSAQIAEEIKNGSFDWKRAVVINELLRQQHFR